MLGTDNWYMYCTYNTLSAGYDITMYVYRKSETQDIV